MKPIKWIFLGVLLGLTVLWLLADTLLPEPFSYFSFRAVFVQYSGILAMGMMSVAMLLAIRPKWMERPLSGLDKMYRLHKWLGVGGLVFAVLHWWWAQGTKWMVGWGWLERPQRRGPPEDAFSQLGQWLHGQRDLAETLGEWAFYATAILITLALIQAFPYRWFRKLHTWLAVTYLILVYHSLVLIKPIYWLQPVGWAVGLLLLTGTMSAMVVLAGQVARKRQVRGVIESITHYSPLRVIEASIALESGWPGHRPGQFAFVTSKRSEGAHPYTIASAWNPSERRLTFIIKALGDWTGQLKDWLKVGMPIAVEGPYGCFDFDDDRPRQIWIGAGIGITPFVAKMKHLARAPGQQEIHLFHTTADYDQTAIDKLTTDARAANVRLHLTVSSRDGFLTAEKIRQAVPGWRSASLWFCGPAAFGDTLRRDFLKHGLPARDFHQELFKMR